MSAPVDLTKEALQYYLIENGCKVSQGEAVEFFRINFAHRVSNFVENKELFKKYMDELTRAETTDTGDRYLILKRQFMVPSASPHPFGSPRSLRGSPRLSSPRTSKQERMGLMLARTPPQSPRITVNLTSSMEFQSDDGRSPLGSCGYDSEELEEDDFNEMELGSVGGCSTQNVPLEACQRDWIISTVTGDMESIARLLLQDKSLVRYRDSKHFSGYSGLHWACKHGRTDIAHVLLQVEGCDVNCRASNGMTSLHIAAQAGHEQLVEFLVDKGADKFARDYKGKYPSHYLPSRCSERVRDLIAPPIITSHKPRTTPTLNRRPSLSSLDDARRDGEKPGKQYMSAPLKLLRSSFRKKRDLGDPPLVGGGRQSPAGSPSSSSINSPPSSVCSTESPLGSPTGTSELRSSVNFVRPMKAVKSSRPYGPKPPTATSAALNKLRSSVRIKRTHS